MILYLTSTKLAFQCPRARNGCGLSGSLLRLISYRRAGRNQPYTRSTVVKMADLIGVFEEKDQAALYARYRPVYPEKVMEIISHYMDSNGCSGYERAVDVCCGSGQATMLLSKRFREVYSYDISSEQISQAQHVHRNATSNVNFAVGDAHHLPIETSSVDLLTTALGWHWLDPDKFYSEAKRVLKPRGCIAVYGLDFKVTE